MMLSGRFENSLVLVSIVVAILASYTALSMAGRVTVSRKSATYRWIAGGAFAMGAGIWSMHFIGMLAYRLPMPLGYDLRITLVSLLIPVAVSGMALWQVSQPELPPNRLLAGALLMGVGINTMHYTGMAAMRMQPGILYDPMLVAASIAIAISAAGAALWIAFKLRMNTPHVWLARAGAAVIMGIAIAGMHYTGMAAANFPADSICMAAQQGFSADGLAIMVIIATLAVLGIALLTSVYDARLEARSHILAISQATAEERQILLVRERVARTEAEQMSKMKDEFLATLSHELRTPLNSVLGWSEILLREVKDEATLRKGLVTIERNARAQAQLIDDLLDMSRIISGKVRLDMQLVDPVSFIEAAMETVRPAAMAKSIQLEKLLGPDTGPDTGPISGDPNRLQQVMWNLLANAVKFTPDGGKVQVVLERLGGRIEISVVDTGIGIKPEFLPHVFDRFRQEDASTTRRHGGLGLGLAIAKHLVELQGGTVRVASHGDRKGTTFTVCLPLAEMQATMVNESPGHPKSRHASRMDFRPVNLSGVKVLVIDDEADARDLVERILRDCDAEVIKAAAADQALLLIEREKPDVLVSDIGMPDVDGFELVRRVRALRPAQGGNIPAIALTAFTRADDRKRALSAGFTLYMSKPVGPSELVSNIESVVGRPGVMRQRSHGHHQA